MISVIIPAFNAEKTIKNCLESIFNQTEKNFEVIIVNDGSKDKTIEIIEKLKKSNNWQIKLINQENKGAPAARNRGFKESRGDYLIFCDADIILKSKILETMKNTLKKYPEASYAYSSFKFGWKTFKLWPFDASRLRKMPYIHTTSLIRREHFPGFDESLRKFQDWDLWLTMLEQGHKGVWIPEILFEVVNTKGTISTWLPSFFYKLPWRLLGFSPKTLKEYKKASEIIKIKHILE